MDIKTNAMATPTAEELLNKAKELYKAAKYEEVIDLLPDELLALYINVDLYLAKSDASSHLNKWDITISATEKALAIDPDNKTALHQRGNAHYNLKRYELAIADYRRLIADDTEFTKKGYYGLAICFTALHQSEEAIEYFNKRLELDPLSALAYNGLGNVYQDDKKLPEMAITYYSKAIELDPKMSYPYNGLGNAYNDIDQLDKAMENYNKSLEIDPQYAYAYNGLGNVYRRLKQPEKAVEFFTRSIELDPQYPFPFNGLGNAYHDLNEPDKALESYRKSIALAPRANPYVGMGLVYQSLEEPIKAIQSYSDAIAVEPNFDTSYYNRARLYFESGKYESALSDYQKYIELTKENPDYYTSQAKSRVSEIEKLLDIPGFRKITESVNQIKELLRFNDACVTHYTGLSVAKALVLEDSPLRLSEGAYLNDTSEGRELFKYLSIHATPVKSSDTIAEPFARKPFIGSFVAESRHDDLTLWRMYGKEAKEEAKGCAVTIKKDLLLENLKLTLKGPKDNTGTNMVTDKELSFYRVAYRSQDDKSQFFIPSAKADENKLNKYMRELARLVSVYVKKQDSASNLQNLLERLNEITYLFKSAEYQYEHEIRLVISGIGFEKHVDNGFTPPRVYIKLVPINPAIASITLGPKVERSDEWASAFYYTLEKQEHYPKILISHLPFK